MLVEAGEADGLVAGARTSTAATIEPALRVRRLHPGLGPISSCFIMELACGRGVTVPDGVLVFTDCALNPDPSPAVLAQIAIAGARLARELCEIEPRVALLSFSTHGSARHERVEKVRQALAVFSSDPKLGDAMIWTLGAERAFGDGTLLITLAANARGTPVDTLLLVDRAILPALIAVWQRTERWGSW